MIHSSNERKRDAKSVMTSKTLTKLVYSINTSKVTENRTEDENTGKEEESDDDGNPGTSKKIAIEGMQVLDETKRQPCYLRWLQQMRKERTTRRTERKVKMRAKK